MYSCFFFKIRFIFIFSRRFFFLKHHNFCLLWLHIHNTLHNTQDFSFPPPWVMFKWRFLILLMPYIFLVCFYATLSCFFFLRLSFCRPCFTSLSCRLYIKILPVDSFPIFFFLLASSHFFQSWFFPYLCSIGLFPFSCIKFDTHISLLVSF